MSKVQQNEDLLAFRKNQLERQDENNKVLNSALKEAKKKLEKDNIKVTQETLATQVYMQGNNGRFDKDELMRKADAYCKKNQKILFVLGLFALTVLNFVLLCVRYVYCFVTLEKVIVNNNPIYLLLSVVLPIVAWVLMTTQEDFNYYDRKFSALILVVSNAVATILQPLYTLIWSIAVPKIFNISINDAMTQNMVTNLARIVIAIGMGLGFLLVIKTIYPFLFAQEAKEALLTFKLKHVVDLREDKEYKYDFKVMYALKTGKDIIIKEKDRFVHFLLLGASGTGKTSTIYERQILEDMKTKIKNIEMQQKSVLKMVQAGYVKVKEPFETFNKRYFECVPEHQGEFDEIFERYRDCGITVVAPNNSMNEHLLKMAAARGLKINNLDPSKKKATSEYERLIGMNPFVLPVKFTLLVPEDTEGEEERTIYIAEHANAFADALAAINEGAGTGDAYFTDVNTTVTSNITTVAMLDASITGKQIDIGDIYNLITDFNLLTPIVGRIEKHFSIHLPSYKKESKNSRGTPQSYDNMVANQDDITESNELDQHTKENPYAKTLITVKSRLVKDSKMDEHAEGLRNLLGKLLQDPRVTRVLMPKGETIDFNKILSDNEITVVNTALEFGSTTSTCFGQLFLLNFNNAVLARPKDARDPHFFFEDETARYLAKTIDTMITLYRQYNVSCTFALQLMSQVSANPNTRFLKDILLSVGTAIVFGRTNVEDSKTISDLGGQQEYEMVQKTRSRSSILSDSPSSSTSERTTPDQKNVVEANDVRFRDFQEMTILTSDEGRVLPAILAKGKFVPKEEMEPKEDIIDRSKKWTMVWRARFPKNVTVTKIDKSSVTPSKEQQQDQIKLGKVPERTGMNIPASKEQQSTGIKLKEYNLQQMLEPNLFEKMPYDELDELPDDEDYGFEGITIPDIDSKPDTPSSEKGKTDKTIQDEFLESQKKKLQEIRARKDGLI